MNTTLPARPSLEHLRTQAKQLLGQLRANDDLAAQTFIDHLPAARRMTPDQVRRAGFRLADAQSPIARKAGFAAWPALARHVEQLRALEGEWQFLSLEIDGAGMPASMLGKSRLLIDGDRFRTESPESDSEGISPSTSRPIPPPSTSSSSKARRPAIGRTGSRAKAAADARSASGSASPNDETERIAALIAAAASGLPLIGAADRSSRLAPTPSTMPKPR
jgi:hypothetical protein